MEKFNLNEISLENEQEKLSFCELWPNVKRGLELLKTIIRNPVVKATIDIVIRLGDSIC